MKLKSVLLTFGLALGVGGTIGATAASQLNEKPVETKADAATYYVVGSTNVCGVEWQASNQSCPVTSDQSLRYCFAASNAGNYEFKVLKTSGDWNSNLTYSDLDTGCSAYSRLYNKDGNIGIYIANDDANAWKKSVYAISVDSSNKIHVDIAWNYWGTDTDKTEATSGSWAASQNHYLVDGGPAVEWTVSAGEQFKLTNRLDQYGNDYDCYLAGTAGGISITGGQKDNKYCQHDGTYSLQLASGTLYVDYVEGTKFYYSGSDAEKAGTAWTPYTDKPIVLNGSAVEFSFAKDEKFGIVCEDGAYFGLNRLGDNYFNCFGYDGNDIKANMAYDHYTISVTATDRSIKIIPSAIKQTTKTNYVLDLNGDLLSANPKAHHWHTVSSTLTVGDEWPGMNMGVVSGADNLYEIVYWDKFDSLQFNNGTTSTIDYNNLEDGKCLILGWGYDNDAGKWTSNCWISLGAAKFIANYLKFAVDGAHEGAQGSGLCKTGWYSSAKDAYELLNESVQKDVCSSSLALARLQAWAIANGDTFVVTDGVGAFNASRTVNMFAMNEVTNNGSLIAVVAITALAAAAGMFFVFRHKEQ